MEQSVKGTGGLVNRERAANLLCAKLGAQLEIMLLVKEDGVSPSEPAQGGGVLLPPDCADQEQVLDSELWDLLKCVTLQEH